MNCFESCKLLGSYRNVYKKSSAKRECHDGNVFLKADRDLSKFNFFFHLKSKTNLVSLRKCNSHLQYYKIDLSFSIKSQEINLYIFEKYKNKREAQRSNNSESNARTAMRMIFALLFTSSRYKIVHCATREKKIYFASVKVAAQAKRGQKSQE